MTDGDDCPRQSVGSLQGQAPCRKHGQDARATFAPFDHRSVRKQHGAYLPHWNQEYATYGVTFRLADSLPRQVLEGWKRERAEIVHRAQVMRRPLTNHEVCRLDELQSDRMQQYLDAARGECHLRDPRVAQIVRNALLCFDGQRYGLVVWCVMPNHVHAVLQPNPGYDLKGILHSWKSYTANEANKALGRRGIFWQPESFDHLIRDLDDYERAIAYVLGNPHNAGLSEWSWVGCGTILSRMSSRIVRPPQEEHGQDARATGGASSKGC